MFLAPSPPTLQAQERHMAQFLARHRLGVGSHVRIRRLGGDIGVEGKAFLRCRANYQTPTSRRKSPPASAKLCRVTFPPAQRKVKDGDGTMPRRRAHRQGRPRGSLSFLLEPPEQSGEGAMPAVPCGRQDRRSGRPLRVPSRGDGERSSTASPPDRRKSPSVGRPLLLHRLSPSHHSHPRLKVSLTLIKEANLVAWQILSYLFALQ